MSVKAAIIQNSTGSIARYCPLTASRNCCFSVFLSRAARSRLRRLPRLTIPRFHGIQSKDISAIVRPSSDGSVDSGFSFIKIDSETASLPPADRGGQCRNALHFVPLLIEECCLRFYAAVFSVTVIWLFSIFAS